jgi:predicted membrane protein
MSILFSLLLIFSCEQSADHSQKNFTIEWFIKYNDGLFQRIKKATQEKGNRKSDANIVVQAINLISKNRQTINSLDRTNINNQIFKLIDYWKDELQIEDELISQYFETSDFKNLTLNELKERILMFELEVLSVLGSGLGAEDMSFEKFDIYFIPDNLFNSSNGNISGKLIFAGTSGFTGEYADFYFDDVKIEEINGYGRVDLNSNILKARDSVEIKVKFSEGEIKKFIPLK